METQRYKLDIVFTSPILGTQPGKDSPASRYIAEKRAKAGLEEMPDEALTLPEELERGTTGFHRLDGDPDQPILYDYMVKGFFKEVGSAFNPLRGVKNLRSKLENFLFVDTRQIKLEMPSEDSLFIVERPLRAMTMQGPRTALARSEALPEGTRLSCVLKLYTAGPISEAMLRDLLDYGADKGLGQWRTGGHGRFTYALEATA